MDEVKTIPDDDLAPVLRDVADRLDSSGRTVAGAALREAVRRLEARGGLLAALKLDLLAFESLWEHTDWGDGELEDAVLRLRGVIAKAEGREG